MHELSIASGMIERIANRVERRDTVTSVHVTLGPLSGICAESLAFSFDILAKQQGFSRATLEIEQKSAMAACNACQREFEVRLDMDILSCPYCGSMERDITSGSQFTLDYVETED